MEEKKGKNKKGRFTKGNNYAKGNKGKGKYKKAYINEMILYFSAEPAPGVEYPMFEGFAKKIGVTVRPSAVKVRVNMTIWKGTIMENRHR